VKIESLDLKIEDLVAGYHDDGESGVRGYSKKLDIRPPYQREFIYKAKQQEAVISSVLRGFPLNAMYWASRDDGSYEVIDGQQRTISIARYIYNSFSVEDRYYDNLPFDIKRRLLNYELMIYICSGTDSEKLDWFRTINIAGETLTEQELRNATYAGPWLSDAKRRFSRAGGAAASLAGDYLSGSPIRQDYLETAIRWMSQSEGTSIEDCMARNQHLHSANQLWAYFTSVIYWLKSVFPVTRSKLMKPVNWGALYDSYKHKNLDPARLEKDIARLIMDDDVTRKSGIYPYLLTGNEKHLNIRAFTPAMRLSVYQKQQGKCVICRQEFDLENMEADHIHPWSKGGKTDADNCQMLCRPCNRNKAAS